MCPWYLSRQQIRQAPKCDAKNTDISIGKKLGLCLAGKLETSVS